MDSRVLPWAAAEIGLARPHLRKALCRASNFTSTLSSLFCFSTCTSTTSPWPGPHAGCSWWGCSYPLAARRRTCSPGWCMRCMRHSASGTCSAGAAPSHSPSCLMLSKMCEGGLTYYMACVCPLHDHTLILPAMKDVCRVPAMKDVCRIKYRLVGRLRSTVAAKKGEGGV